jgi:hypothetical protein
MGGEAEKINILFEAHKKKPPVKHMLIWKDNWKRVLYKYRA